VSKSIVRNAVKAVAAAGGLLLLAAPAPADESEDASTALTGEWFNGGKFKILNGWGGNEVGKVSERGKLIAWKGGGNWKRR
jgi:hypothetical protein